MNNRKLATYVELVIKQRTRAREQFKSQYGEDSAAIGEMDKEIGELNEYVNNLKIYGNELVTVDGKPDLFAKANEPEPKK